MPAGANDPLSAFTKAATTIGKCKSPDHAVHRFQQVFEGIDLAGKNVLDVGAGSGLGSAYAVAQGARHVIALEPEAAGASSGSAQRILRVRDAMGMPSFEAHPQPVQDYDPGDLRFDVVLMHQSINHLDEPMCEELQDNPEARRVYQEVFRSN